MHGVGPFTGSIMTRARRDSIFDSTFSLRLNGVRCNGWTAGVTFGSTCSDTCLVFSLPTPLNTAGYCCLSNFTSDVSAIAAMLIPILSIPNVIAVSLPIKGIPFPFITRNSAGAILFPAWTLQPNVPLIVSGWFDAYMCTTVYQSGSHSMCI